MSAPPLPPTFGNYALGDIAEVVAPPAIDWLPQTPGWYLVLAIVLAFAARRAWRALRKWYRNRYRREALTRLRELADAGDDSIALARGANTLLKLTAMAARSRAEVASLTGAAWVSWLNAQCPGAVFGAREAQVLVEGSYRELPLDEETRASLFSAMARWITDHGESTT